MTHISDPVDTATVTILEGLSRYTPRGRESELAKKANMKDMINTTVCGQWISHSRRPNVANLETVHLRKICTF